MSLSVSDLLLPGVPIRFEPSHPPQTLSPQRKCAVLSCPHLLHEGYPVRQILKPTNIFAFQYLQGQFDGHLCAACALLFLNDHSLGGRIATEDGYQDNQPFRPWMPRLKNTFETRLGQKAVFLLTNDSRPRLWPLAPMTIVNETFDIYLKISARVDRFAEFEGPVRCRYSVLEEFVEIFTLFLSCGLSRTDIRKGTRSHRLLNRLQQKNLHPLFGPIEQSLEWMRRQPEFLPALFIVSPNLESENNPNGNCPPLTQSDPDQS